MKNNVKIFAGTAIGIVMGVALSFSFFFIYQKFNSQARMAELSRQLAKACAVNENAIDTGYIHTNEQFKFQFSYPKNLIACSQPDGKTTPLFRRSEFLSPSGEFGPVAVITVNAPMPNNAPPQTVMSEEKITVGGMPATKKQIRSGSCVKPECEIMVYELTKNSNTFSIWGYERIDYLLKDFIFND